MNSTSKRRRVVVMHGGYGCETGCCGHTVAIVPPDAVIEDAWDLDDAEHKFGLDHPGMFCPGGIETDRQFAERLITEKYGPDHVADLDWEASVILHD